MKKLIAPAFVLCLIGLIAITWLAPQGLRQLPSVSFYTLDGQLQNTQQFSGKPAFITFWATSCVSCIKEVPYLVNLHKKYSPQGLNILGVAMDYDPIADIIRFQQERQLPYTLSHDKTNSIATAFGIGDTKLTPTNFLIGPDGRIIFQNIGEVDFQFIENQIKALL